MVSRTEQGPHATVLRVARSSTVDLIAVELRNAIYSGALAVGSPLGEVEISSQLGVSRSPLREATQRLVQEGVLTATPGRGLRVSVVDKDHLRDLYDARAAVESHALRLIARRGDTDAIACLEAGLADLVEASGSDDAQAIGDADLTFHRTLVEASGNRRLAHYMATLVLETRIASFSMSEGYIVRRDVDPTYRRIIDALRSGDAEAAVRALEMQLDGAVARLQGEPVGGPDVETIEQPVSDERPPLSPLTVEETDG